MDGQRGPPGVVVECVGVCGDDVLEVEFVVVPAGLFDADAARAFVERAFRDGAIPTAGAAVTAILPPTSRFAGDDSYGLKKQAVLDRLGAFFERYFTLG